MLALVRKASTASGLGPGRLPESVCRGCVPTGNSECLLQQTGSASKTRVSALPVASEKFSVPTGPWPCLSRAIPGVEGRQRCSI